MHHLAGFDLTFWAYQSHDHTEAEPGKLGGALFALHEALAAFPDPLPRYDDELDQVSRILTDARRSPGLQDADRSVLLAGLHRFRAAITLVEVVFTLPHGARLRPTPGHGDTAAAECSDE